MSLSELIAELCPSGVEIRALTEVSGFMSGFAFKSSTFSKVGTPVCKTTNIQNGIVDFNGMSCISPDEYKENLDKYIVYPQDIVIGMSGTIKVGINNTNSFCYLNQRVGKFLPNGDVLDNKYLYYFLCNIESSLSESVVGGSVKNLSNSDILNLEIPVPPIEVQREIVRILDNFTELTAELTAELAARKKQYEYYKMQIMPFAKNVPIKHITDIALVKARVGWQRLTTAEYLTEGDYYLITGTDFNSGGINFDSCVFVSKERYEMDENIQVHKDDILITKDGTLGKVAILSEEPNKPTTLNSGVFRIHIVDKNVLPRYIFHFFTSKVFTDFVESVKTGSTIPHLTQQGLLTLDIPVPPLDVQERIIHVLDNFDAICTDLKTGLPAEIEARKKQYEYYRDQLLTFTPAE